jgi:hypothetical protein
MLFVHKLRLFYFPPSTVSSQTVEAIYHCAEMLTQTFKSDLFLRAPLKTPQQTYKMR